jgi:hypothetical protein
VTSAAFDFTPRQRLCRERSFSRGYRLQESLIATPGARGPLHPFPDRFRQGGSIILLIDLSLPVQGDRYYPLLPIKQEDQAVRLHTNQLDDF